MKKIIILLMLMFMVAGCSVVPEVNNIEAYITRWTQDDYEWSLGKTARCGWDCCPQCPDCDSCCPDCPACDSCCNCPDCDSCCPECEECQVCPVCETCEVCEECICPVCQECPECNCPEYHCCECKNGKLTIYYTLVNNGENILKVTVSFMVHAADDCDVITPVISAEEYDLLAGETRECMAEYDIDETVVWIEIIDVL
jgi:hypothetical protein